MVFKIIDCRTESTNNQVACIMIRDLVANLSLSCMMIRCKSMQCYWVLIFQANQYRHVDHYNIIHAIEIVKGTSKKT